MANPTFVVMSGRGMEAMLKAEKASTQGIDGFDKDKIMFVVDSSASSYDKVRKLIHDNTGEGFQAGSVPAGASVYTIIPLSVADELADKITIVQVANREELDKAKKAMIRERFEPGRESGDVGKG